MIKPTNAATVTMPQLTLHVDNANATDEVSTPAKDARLTRRSGAVGPDGRSAMRRNELRSGPVPPPIEDDSDPIRAAIAAAPSSATANSRTETASAKIDKLLSLSNSVLHPRVVHAGGISSVSHPIPWI